MNTIHISDLSIELTLPSELGYEKIARDAVGAFARRIGFTSDRIEDLKTALSEACINAIEHGNQRIPSLRVSITCAYHNNRLDVFIADQGKREFIQPDCCPSINEKVQGLARSRGMGLLLIAGLVDEAEFMDRDDGEGNLFRMALLKSAVAVPNG